MNILAAVIAALAALIAPVVSAGENPEGVWTGAIALPNGQELAIVVNLAHDDSVWSGTISIPAQGLSGFELSDVDVDGADVSFAMDGVPGRPAFDGRMSDDGSRIRGEFAQGGAQLEFSLERGSEADDERTDVDYEGVPGEGITGSWLGPLRVGPQTLRLVLDVERAGDGYTAVLDSIDQGSKLPVETIELTEGSLRFQVPRVGGAYEGTVSSDGSEITGTWSQGGMSLPLTFYRQTERYELKRPQEPRPPFPYEATDVRFQGGDQEVTLAGTILIPDGEGPFPAVVFATGSGAQDRDESLMGHKPFLVIADHLARNGIASLRYDDRGFGESTGDHLGSTVDDFAADLAAALAFFARHDQVDAAALGILGHSEGGLSALKVAAADTDSADFIVMLAGPGEKLSALLERQSRALMTLNGVEPELLDRAMESFQRDIALVADESLSRRELVETLRAIALEEMEKFTEEERAILGFNETVLETNLVQTSTPWFRSLMREDPAEYLEEIEVPVLALFGEKDFQVDPVINSRLMKEGLETNPHAEIEILQNLNHLFQTAESGAIGEYAEIEETIAPEVLERITEWIVATVD